MWQQQELEAKTWQMSGIWLVRYKLEMREAEKNLIYSAGKPLPKDPFKT